MSPELKLFSMEVTMMLLFAPLVSPRTSSTSTTALGATSGSSATSLESTSASVVMISMLAVLSDSLSPTELPAGSFVPSGDFSVMTPFTFSTTSFASLIRFCRDTSTSGNFSAPVPSFFPASSDSASHTNCSSFLTSTWLPQTTNSERSLCC